MITNNSIKMNNIYMKKEHAAILSFVPILKLHDIVVFSDNNEVLTIDYTPINQSRPEILLKLFMGKYVPAEVRIRRMAAWNLTEWYASPLSTLDDISDNVLRNKIINIIDAWNDNTIDRGFGMNLYKRNCKHFSNFVILNFFL